VAFNQMWREHGINWQWNLEQYAQKVKIGGGKERMFSLGKDEDFRAAYPVPESESAWWNIVMGWHKRKTEIYKQAIASGAIPDRPGVKRLAQAALANGWLLAVCSTSVIASVEAVLRQVMGSNWPVNSLEFLRGIWSKPKNPPQMFTISLWKN